MKKILITGCSGFVGKELIRKLSKRSDIYLYLLVNKNKIINKKKNSKIINCSLEEKVKLKKKISSLKIEYVIHCAWKGVKALERNSINQKKNLMIVKNIFYALNTKNIKAFIGIGSQAEYSPNKKIIYENSKLNPLTKYGKTKVDVYKYLKKQCKIKNIRLVWLRIFSGYGPGSNKKWLIPYIINGLLMKKKMKFTAGNQKYNFIFIWDIISAIEKAIIKKNANDAYNLAYSKSYKINSVIRLIFKKLKIKEKSSFGSLKYRKDQIMNYTPSIEKIKKDLNWKPEYSLSKGLDITIDYIKKNLKK